MECGWYAYQSKTGQTLFFFNKNTGEYKWLSCSCTKNLNPWVADNDAFKATNPKVIEHDIPTNMTKVLVRSIAIETDFPAAPKILKTQGTQTECLEGDSCTDDTKTQNVLPTVALKNGSHQGDGCKSSLSRNTSVFQENNSHGKCRDKEKSKVPRSSIEPKQSLKVKLFDCSYCEKAFTSYAFLVKHEKWHVENDIQKKLCDELDETIIEDSISSDPVAEFEKNDPQASSDASGPKNTPCSTLIDTPPSSEVDSTCSSAFSQVCFQCGKNCTSQDEFESHLEEHIKERFCRPCQKPFGNNKQFVNHLGNFHVKRRHKCPRCSNKYLLKSSLDVHLREFHKVISNKEPKKDSYSYTCGSCKASFKLSNKFSEHQKVMKHKGTEYQCDECGNFFTQFDDLQQHVMQEHRPDSQSTSSSSLNSAHEKPSQCKKGSDEKGDPDYLPEEKSNERYWCDKCNVSYLWSYDLVRHKVKKKCCMDKPVIIMNGECQQYLCRYDDRVFNDKETFIKHYSKHFQKSALPISCDQCTTTFPTFKSLEKHLAFHLDQQIKETKTHSCVVCGKSFSSSKSCRRHVQRNHKTERLDNSNKIDHHRNTLPSHKKIHNSFIKEEAQQVTETVTNTAAEPQTKQQKPVELSATSTQTHRKFKCSKCKKTFMNLECLRRHKKMLNHGEVSHLKSSHVPKTEVAVPKSRGSIIYHCPVCKKSFKYYNVFYRHKATHGDKIRACKICAKYFKPSTLSSDNCLSCKKLPQKVIEELYSCKVCGKGFLGSISLRNHMQAHNRGQFDCTSCGIAFSNAERLKRHIKNHKREISKMKDFKPCKEKWHECGKCGKLYAGRKSVVKHRKICMGQKESAQPGNLAGNKASSKITVKKEDPKKSNTKGQTFRCQKCQKSFSLYSELYDHCSEHGEEKPCCVCNKFMAAASLKRHLCEMHLTDHTFYCHVCSKEFYDLNDLINHISTFPGVKKHKCTECGQLYALCGRLQDHIRLVHAQR